MKERKNPALTHATFPKKPGNNTDKKHDDHGRSFIQISHNAHRSIIVVVCPARVINRLRFLGTTVVIVIVIIAVLVGIVGWLSIHFRKVLVCV
jgi:hypothetical protein